MTINHPWDKKEVVYSSKSYQAKSWSKERRVCIKSTREADELLFRHEYIITNYSNNVSAETVFWMYSKRGTMENFIKEAKNGFYFDKTDSPSFLENQARMMSIRNCSIKSSEISSNSVGKWNGLNLKSDFFSRDECVQSWLNSHGLTKRLRFLNLLESET